MNVSAAGTASGPGVASGAKGFGSLTAASPVTVEPTSTLMAVCNPLPSSATASTNAVTTSVPKAESSPDQSAVTHQSSLLHDPPSFHEVSSTHEPSSTHQLSSYQPSDATHDSAKMSADSAAAPASHAHRSGSTPPRPAVKTCRDSSDSKPMRCWRLFRACLRRWVMSATYRVRESGPASDSSRAIHELHCGSSEKDRPRIGHSLTTTPTNSPIITNAANPLGGLAGQWTDTHGRPLGSASHGWVRRSRQAASVTRRPPRRQPP